MSTLVSIGEAAEALGVSITTLRRWEKTGKIQVIHSAGKHRRYDLAAILPERFRPADMSDRKTVAYARASGPDREADLARQKQALEIYCTRNGWTYEIVTDTGSGLNCRKQGLIRLLNAVIGNQVGRLVITHRDRLLRFGADLVFAVCAAKQVEVVILNQGGEGGDTAPEEDLFDDVAEIVKVFSARLYGARSRKHQKLLDDIKAAVAAVK